MGVPRNGAGIEVLLSIEMFFRRREKAIFLVAPNQICFPESIVRDQHFLIYQNLEIGTNIFATSRDTEKKARHIGRLFLADGAMSIDCRREDLNLCRRQRICRSA